MDERTRGQRIQALLILADEFVRAGVPVAQGLGDVQSRFGPQVGAFAMQGADEAAAEEQQEQRSTASRHSSRGDGLD